MTISLVSMFPAHLATGVDPAAPIEIVIERTGGGTLSLGNWTIYYIGSAIPGGVSSGGAVVANSVANAAWTFTEALSAGDTICTITLIPTAGWGALEDWTLADGTHGIWVSDYIGEENYELANEPYFETGEDVAPEELSGTELGQYEIDAPIISWRTETRHATISLWNTTGDGAFDNGDPYYPESRAFDEIGDIPSRSGTHDTTVFYVLDLGEPREIDCCLLLGNFDRLTTCTQVRLTIGTGIEFSSSLTIVEWDDPGRRCASWTLGAGLDPAITIAGRYSARYVRVEIDYAGSGEYPELWELFLARRWSPPGHPLLPVSIDAASSSVTAWDSASGHARSLPAVRERRAASLVWPLVGSTVQGAAQDWGDSIEAGAHPCLLCLRPLSGPEETMLVRVAADVFSAPWTGPLDQRITVDFEEQAPFIARDP